MTHNRSIRHILSRVGFKNRVVVIIEFGVNSNKRDNCTYQAY